MRIKIVGAGSAGIHHAHAAWLLGWDVSVTDTDLAAIERMPDIYEARYYGAWDANIRLIYGPSGPDDALWPDRAAAKYDLIVVATPPESHVQLALKALDQAPIVLIEKPLCAPDQVEEAKALLGKPVYVGYLHSLGLHPLYAEEIVGTPVTLDIRWQEHWDGIFKAHPWLKGPEDSYLGYWKRGGGAVSEHSHALHLWQRFARSAGEGRVAKVSANADYAGDYDQSATVALVTETGFCGTVFVDVMTKPTIKRASLRGANGRIKQDFDSRDFKHQLEHVAKAPEDSPLSIERGLETAALISAIHRSAHEGGAWIGLA